MLLTNIFNFVILFLTKSLKIISKNILQYLQHVPVSVSTLAKSVAFKTKTTLPGVYKALHTLEKSSQILVSNKEVRLSLIEIQKEKDRLERIENNYIISS